MASVASKLNSKPKTAADLAKQTGLGIDSVRRQIQQLLADGKAKVAGYAKTGQRGRPAKQYVAA